MTSARDAIWIDMMQFDAGNADGLWEGGAPPPDAPLWYSDVSGLIRRSTGPAESHELVDEPVVVEDMHLTTVERPRAPRRQHHRAGRTVRRMIAVKAAAATTASVFGVAAAAAATTGIVATVANVVVPAIEEHVFTAPEDPESASPAALPPSAFVRGGPDSRNADERLSTAEARPATPLPAVAAPPADAAASLLDLADAAELQPPAELQTPAEPPPPAEPGPSEPVPAEPVPTAPAPAQPGPPEPAPGGPGPGDRVSRRPVDDDTGRPEPPPVAHAPAEGAPPAPMASGGLRPEAG